MPDFLLGSGAPAAGCGASIYINPAFRYAGDDWSGENALGFVVYAVAPTYDASGNVLTSGIVRPLTGCTVTGTARYQTRCATPAPTQAGLVALTGSIVDPANGGIALSLPAAQAIFPAQDRPYGTAARQIRAARSCWCSRASPAPTAPW